MIKDEGGQSLTEFAVILPIFLLLVCGIFDFGRLMYAYMNMNNVAQETVRLGGFDRKDSEIVAFAKNYVHLGDASNLKVTISPVEAVRHSGDYVTVTLEYPFTYVTPIISKLLPAPTVKAASTIRVE
ncbi:TadE-like protein [Paenibacillus sp. yr247]|uniref:TadE/TadG family type IV pilus assembly protein n=1 Tax=Paenibacillus sp. yr247 TaxID=1761880 RepID=UPI00088AE3AC|nr:TadE/TadG family type IV pilus assembly protein [Paenibacillus sp. yr247]SDP05527.1 TadE-like protein [Paenibacillus sp. yr247]